MSIAYYLFNKDTNECVYLGKKNVRDDYEYEGPLFYIGNKRYLLPLNLLDLLVSRFYGSGSEGSVQIIRSDDLFDSDEFIGENASVVEIGGENYLDLPLTKYLPELKDKSHILDLISNGIEIT